MLLGSFVAPWSPSASAETNSNVVAIDWPAFTHGAPTDYLSLRWRDLLRAGAAEIVSLGQWPTPDGYYDFGPNCSDIRYPSSQALGLAIAYKLGALDHDPNGLKVQAKQKAILLIKSLAFRHRASNLTSTDPRIWGFRYDTDYCNPSNPGNPAAGGSNWQATWMASMSGFAGWLMWDEDDLTVPFTAADKERVRLMVEYEADRFINTPAYHFWAIPDNHFDIMNVGYRKDRNDAFIGHPGDTKSEEDAWNVRILPVAVAMMPNHARRAMWLNKAEELSIAAFSRPSDHNDTTTMLHGKSLYNWLNGSNIQQSGLMINGLIVAPLYMTAVTHSLSGALAYSMAKMSLPKGTLFNADKVYGSFFNYNFPYPGPDTSSDPDLNGRYYKAPGGFIYKGGVTDVYLPQNEPDRPQVEWVNRVGVTVDYVPNGQLTDVYLRKTAPSGWSNAGAISNQSIESGDGYVEFTVDSTAHNIMFGLSHRNTNQHYNDIDFAAHLQGGGSNRLMVYEGGVFRDLGYNRYYAAGDIIKVAVTGNVVRYYQNQQLFYTSSVTPTYPLLLDTSLYETGSRIKNAYISTVIKKFEVFALMDAQAGAMGFVPQGVNSDYWEGLHTQRMLDQSADGQRPWELYKIGEGYMTRWLRHQGYFRQLNGQTWTDSFSDVPQPWIDGDVGRVTTPGKTTYASGAYTALGSGSSDAWSLQRDHLHYTYQVWHGDGEIIARRPSWTPVGGIAQAGVMIRESLAWDSRYAWMLFQNDQTYPYFRYRETAGQNAQWQLGSNSGSWLKLARAGNTFSGYTSTNGSTWVHTFSKTISMGSSVYVGLAVSSWDQAGRTSATFDNVSVSRAGVQHAVAPNPVASRTDVGAPENTIDNLLNTSWSAIDADWDNLSGETIYYDLNSTKTVNAASIGWLYGDQRIASFDIQRWTGLNWQTIYRGTSSGGTNGSLALEKYYFAPVTTQYVRILGRGNSTGQWVSLTEVKLYGPLSGGDACSPCK